MATYIPNLTDKITPPYLYTPDLKFLIQSGQAAKQLYDIYLQQAAEIYGTYANTDLYNKQISKVRDEYIKSIDNTIKQITKVDWLNAPSDYINAVSKSFQPLISTPQIAKAFKIVNDYNWFKLKEYEYKDRVIAPPQVKESNKLTDFSAYQIYDPQLSKTADVLFKMYTKMDYNDADLLKINIPQFKLGIDIKAYLHDAFEQIKAKFGGVEGVYYISPDGTYKELKEGDNETLYKIISGPNGEKRALGSVLYAKTKQGGEEKYLPVSDYVLDLLKNPNIQEYYRDKTEAEYIGMLETMTPAEVYKRMYDDIETYKTKYSNEYNLLLDLWNATKLQKDAQEQEIKNFVDNENVLNVEKAAILEKKIKAYQQLKTQSETQLKQLRDLESKLSESDKLKESIGNKLKITQENYESLSKALEGGKVPVTLGDFLKDIKYVTPVLAEYKLRMDAIDYGIDFANALSDTKIQSLGTVGSGGTGSSGGGNGQQNIQTPGSTFNLLSRVAGTTDNKTVTITNPVDNTNIDVSLENVTPTFLNKDLDLPHELKNINSAVKPKEIIEKYMGQIDQKLKENNDFIELKSTSITSRHNDITSEGKFIDYLKEIYNKDNDFKNAINALSKHIKQTQNTIISKMATYLNTNIGNPLFTTKHTQQENEHAKDNFKGQEISYPLFNAKLASAFTPIYVNNDIDLKLDKENVKIDPYTLRNIQNTLNKYIFIVSGVDGSRGTKTENLAYQLKIYKDNTGNKD